MAQQEKLHAKAEPPAAEDVRVDARSKSIAATREQKTRRGEAEELVYRGKCQDRSSVTDAVQTFVNLYERERLNDPDPALENFVLEELGGAPVQVVIWARVRGWGRLPVGHVEFSRLGEQSYRFELWRYGNTLTDSMPQHNSLIDYGAVRSFFADLGEQFKRPFGPNLAGPHAKAPYVPTKRKVLRDWKIAWRFIRASVQRGESVANIRREIAARYPNLPHSEDTLRKIIDAGDAGLLG